MLVTDSELAIITAHPFDLSGARRNAAIAKVEALPAYRIVIEKDEQTQELAIARGKLMHAAVQMGKTGLPRQEHNPEKDNFPCNYCEWKSMCIAQRNEFGLVFPEIPERLTVKPDGGVGVAA